MVRKLKSLLVFVVPFLLVALLTYWMSAAAAPASQTCSVPGNYDAIQAAVNDPTCETINVASGVFTETVTISRTLTIAGQGEASTIVDGDALASVFTVETSGVVTLTGLTITNGLGIDGGGIYNKGGAVTLVHIALSGNSAGNGGGIANFDAMTLTHSTLRGNEANLGGAIANRGTMTLTYSTLSGNSAGDGGGIYNDRSGRLIIDKDTLSGNLASSGVGGGIFNELGTVTVDNSTLSDNSSGAAGGAIASSGPMTLTNSIVANSPTGGDCAGGISSQGYNLDSDGSCNFTTTGDIANAIPLLGPLQDNGGATFTHALLAGSPAIDAGNCPGAGDDQRGYSRPVDILNVANVSDTCDMGAIEVQNNLPTATFCRAPNLAIPDNDPAGVTDTLTISEPGLIIDVDVVISASHEWVGDLSFTLNNDGDSVTIFDRPGVPPSNFGCEEDDIDATLDDDAISPVEDECAVGPPAIDGRFQPNEPLFAFNDRELTGDWMLNVSDNAFNETGALNSWCLVIVYDVDIEDLTASNNGPTPLGQATTLTATISAGTNVSYTWAFGDGETGSGEVTNHIYPATGTYTAEVTATNPLNSSNASTIVNIVDESISGLAAVNDSPTEAGRPTILIATIAAGSNVSYTWTFDDGEMGSGAVVTHTYLLTGTYTAVVTATNSVSTDTKTTSVIITESPFRVYLPYVIKHWLFGISE